MFTEREIIGIDHGNRNIKSHRHIFSASVTSLPSRPDNLENVLEFQDQFYLIGGQSPILETVDKTENMDYYLMTLAAMAKELKSREKRQAAVCIGAALPPRRFGEQSKGFREYLSQHPKLFFRYEGISYQVVVENVYVFMQGHVVIHSIRELCEGFCLLIDIGGGTVDLVGIEDGLPNGFYQIDPRATLYCIHKASEEAVARLGKSVPAYIIESFMRNGTYDCPEKYETLITDSLAGYTEEIYKMISGHGYNEELTRMVFMGGGASIIKHFGKNENKRVQFIPDVRANAKGCEEAVKSILRAKSRRKPA